MLSRLTRLISGVATWTEQVRNASWAGIAVDSSITRRPTPQAFSFRHDDSNRIIVNLDVVVGSGRSWWLREVIDQRRSSDRGVLL